MAHAARNRSKTAGRKPRRTSPAPKREASTPWPTIEEFLDSQEGEITPRRYPPFITPLHRHRQ